MRNKTAVAALSVLALAPALAACGSSAKSSATSTGSASATTSASATATSSATSKASSKASKAAAKAVASTGANGCTPVSKKGNCYQPKEFCAKTQHGTKGIAADGKKIVCKDVNGQWVWQLA